MIQQGDNPARWPEAMSYATVAEYLDLTGSPDPAAKRERGRRFCKEAGIPVLPCGKRLKRVRKADVDAYMGIAQHA